VLSRPKARRSDRPATLYLSYDGLLEPLGESQVVAYLELLANDFAVHVISFEKADDLRDAGRVSAMAARLKAAGMVWHPQRYHKRPAIVSTLWDMTCAVILAVILSIRHRARILHARSVLCAAMLYPARVITRARFLVDIRGFWADERVDGGMIPADGPVYRVLKLIERTMLRRADHIVTLTAASVPYLRDDDRLGRTTAPITVIPTCADLALFSPGAVRGAHPLTIGYVGQIGTWYMLDEMLAFFAAVQRARPDARLLIVNRAQQQEVRQAVARAGIHPEAVELVGAHREGVAAQIRRMDAGLALIHPFFSKIASAPTKFAEYLGCGVPVIGNAGCGDMAAIIERDRVGVAMAETTPAAIEAAVAQLLHRLEDPTIRDRCIASANRHFSLLDGVAKYRIVYHQLAGSPA
jgi:glycosyltransferase involved in cell wall biosynthesis